MAELISQSEFGRRKGVSHTAVGKWVKRGMPMAGSKVDVEAAEAWLAGNATREPVAKVVEAAPVAPTVSMPPAAGTVADAQRRFLELKADTAQLTLEERRGGLISLEEVRQAGSEFATTVKNRVLLVADDVADELAATKDVGACRAILDRALRRALEDLKQIEAMGLVAAWLVMMAPAALISVSEWSERHVILPTETTAKAGRWDTRPYQREILDAASDPSVRAVVVKGGRQLVKTTLHLNTIARNIDVDPGPIMVLVPRGEDAKEFGQERLGPLLRDTVRVRDKVQLSKYSAAPKRFRGGTLAITSAGSAANVAKRPIRYLHCDEIDKFPPSAGDEGGPLVLARECLTTFKHRAKEFYTCSPTYEGSPIDRLYQDSDQREMWVPCPLCGAEQSLMERWHQVRWDSTLPTREEQAFTARYHCIDCDQPWDDQARWAAVDAGTWRAKRPFNGIAGFWISQLYSRDKRLHEIVLQWLKAQANAEDLKAFVNTVLAENHKERGETPDYEVLLGRREEYEVGTVPRGGLVLTAGADVQGDRIEVEVVAWGPGGESWSVLYDVYWGDTAELRGVNGTVSPWEKLEALLGECFPHEGGGDLTIRHLCVDSGDQSQTVYEWVRTQPASRVSAVKGLQRGALPVNPPKPIDINYRGRVIKSGLGLRTVNTAYFKEAFYARLKLRPPSEAELSRGWTYPQGYAHFPNGPHYGDEHFKQVCAEQLVSIVNKRTKRITREWQPVRTRNEALDCRIYAMAAWWICRIHAWKADRWNEARAALGPQQDAFELTAERAEPLPEFARETPPPAVRVDSGWFGGRSRGGWL